MLNDATRGLDAGVDMHIISDNVSTALQSSHLLCMMCVCVSIDNVSLLHSSPVIYCV